MKRTITKSCGSCRGDGAHYSNCDGAVTCNACFGSGTVQETVDGPEYKEGDVVAVRFDGSYTGYPPYEEQGVVIKEMSDLSVIVKLPRDTWGARIYSRDRVRLLEVLDRLARIDITE